MTDPASSQFTGELAGIGTAVAWAFGSIIFSRVPAPASAMNFFKNCVSSLALLLALVITARLGGHAVFHFDDRGWFYLALSAFAGIVVGDTCYFRSLQILGPRRALILTTTVPPFSALFGWFLLGEVLTESLWIGMAVLLLGVAVVIRERGGAAEGAGHFPGSPLVGVAYGVLGSLSQAVGAAWSKIGIGCIEGESTVEATFVRVGSAAVMGAILALPRAQLLPWLTLYFKAQLWRQLLPASLLGTTLGIWLSLVSFKYTKVAVATTLNSLTPIFVLPLVWLFLKQRVSPRAMVGAAIAVVGVALLFAGKSPG